MKLTTTAVALALALSGMFVAAPALAELPSKPGDIRVMDTDRNGKVEKQEYLAFMAKEFEKTAGAKGYCTFAEIDQGFRSLPGAWTFDVSRPGP